MNFSSALRALLGGMACVGCLALLLADSEHAQCASIQFDRTYDMVSTCPGAETTRIRVQAEVNDLSLIHENKMTRSSGNLPSPTMSIKGTCDETNEPLRLQYVGFVIAPSQATSGAGGTGGAAGAGESAGTGAGGAGTAGGTLNSVRLSKSCRLDEGRGDVTCQTDEGCAVQFVLVP